jgi:hypothetical protein
MKYRTLMFAMVVALGAVGATQQAPMWVSTQVKDSFRGTEFTEFSLAGKYLTAPVRASSNNPVLLLHCVPGPHTFGKYDGRLADAYLYPGHTVADANGTHRRNARIPTEYRLDDGKIHAEYLYPSTDFKAISLKAPGCGECVLNDFFYGHQISHKEGTSPQVRKIVVNIPEFKGGDVVIQFDLPDVTEVARACGVTYHK